MRINEIARLIAIIFLIFLTGYNVLYPGIIDAEVWVALSSALAGLAGLATNVPKQLHGNATVQVSKPACIYENICKERERIEIRTKIPG